MMEKYPQEFFTLYINDKYIFRSSVSIDNKANRFKGCIIINPYIFIVHQPSLCFLSQKRINFEAFLFKNQIFESVACKYQWKLKNNESYSFLAILFNESIFFG